jgi:putative spermidine/putrescine transport system ATP-binding protein
MSDPAFLQLKNLTLAYDGNVVVDDLDLTVAEGELVALLGPSGCGKTTTMRAIAGLIQPQRGTIGLAGRDITRVPANKREVGLVFQSYALFPHLSVFENVAFGLRLRGIAREELTRRTDQAIAQVGLDGFERRLPRELSGGQQQRVALARSVVVQPRLLLLDEPLSNLDARLRLEMRSELQRLQRELGVTMIYVTHDQSEALALADRVIVMRAGVIAQQGTPADIYERPVSGFVAQFVGFENMLRVQGNALAGAAGVLPMTFAPEGVAADVAALAWRPGSVVLGEGPHEGHVLGASYLGDAVEYLIQSAAGPLKVQTPADRRRFVLGDVVRFDLPLAAAAKLRKG